MLTTESSFLPLSLLACYLFAACVCVLLCGVCAIVVVEHSACVYLLLIIIVAVVYSLLLLVSSVCVLYCMSLPPPPVCECSQLSHHSMFGMYFILFCLVIPSI